MIIYIHIHIYILKAITVSSNCYIITRTATYFSPAQADIIKRMT